MALRPGVMLSQALKTMFKKTATVSYPAKKEDIFSNFRGKLVFDAEKCVGCNLCARDCPAGALEIEKLGDKQFKAKLLLDHCIFCGQCVESCNRKALECTPEFELADLSREGMKIDI